MLRQPRSDPAAVPGVGSGITGLVIDTRSDDAVELMAEIVQPRPAGENVNESPVPAA